MKTSRTIVGLIPFFLRPRNPYVDDTLSENIRCGTEWQEFDVQGLIHFERDAQIVSVKFKEPFEIDIAGDGGLVDLSGNPISLEMQIVDEKGKTYKNPFSGARGNYIGTYSPEARTAQERVFVRFRIKCNRVVEIEKIMWTSYYLRNRK